MYNHYQGNTGRVRRVNDSEAGAPRSNSHAGQSPAREHSQPQNRQSAPQHGGQGGQNRGGNPPRPISAPGPVSKRPPGPLTGLSGELGRLLSRLSPMNLETEDLILAMILYLMYRDSRDEELLYIMAAMFLM